MLKNLYIDTFPHFWPRLKGSLSLKCGNITIQTCFHIFLSCFNVAYLQNVETLLLRRVSTLPGLQKSVALAGQKH